MRVLFVIQSVVSSFYAKRCRCMASTGRFMVDEPAGRWYGRDWTVFNNLDRFDAVKTRSFSSVALFRAYRGNLRARLAWTGGHAVV